MAHPLSGANLGTLARVIGRSGAPSHALQGAAIGLAALGRWPFSTVEKIVIENKLPALEDMPAPVFILGHWRSGTTHLYNIMCESGAWGFVPPVATGLPWDLFGIARALRPVLERQLPETRYIDNIPVTPTSPQEDEIALANMSPLSFYHGIYFPRAFDRLIDRGVFQEGCSEAEIAGWEARFTYFLRKLARHQGRRLLIKNPVYTARPAQLRRLFPGAKFIHIHRNPFDVFLSMRNFYDRLLAELALQDRPAGLDIDAAILRVYARMMRAFDDQTAGWGAPDLVELPYDLLDRAPMEALARIHDALGLEGFDAAAAAFERYLAGVKSYRKNVFRGDRAAVQTVLAHWRPWVERHGYAVPEPMQGAA